MQATSGKYQRILEKLFFQKLYRLSAEHHEFIYKVKLKDQNVLLFLGKINCLLSLVQKGVYYFFGDGQKIW